MEKIVIIGSGCAGYTAALYTARANLSPLLITGQLPGGLLTQTSRVENYPGFSAGILGPVLMEEMYKQAEQFGCRFKYGYLVTAVDLKSGGPHSIRLDNGESIDSKTLIIATGASHRKLGLKAEAKLETKGVSYCAVCDGAFFRDRSLVVVGGGDSAMEEALYLTKYASKVTIVHRRSQLRASKIMADRVLQHPKIEMAWNSVVTDILGVELDRVTGVRLKDTKTGALRTLECEGLFVAIGHIPNTELFINRLDTDRNGYIRLHERSSHTSVESVFCAGDCADSTYRQAVTAAGMGCKAALDAERWLEANA